MGSPEGARQILAGLKEAGINLVASVPDINMLQLINLLYEDKEIAHVPVGREEEGIGVCTGAHLAGKQPAMLMQNGGLLNSCNGLTYGAPVRYPDIAADLLRGRYGRQRFPYGWPGHRAGAALGIKYTVMRDPAKVKQDIAGAVIAAKLKTAGGFVADASRVVGGSI